MLSSRLVHRVEDHWESLAGSVILRIRRKPELVTIGSLPDSEIRDWCQSVMKNLGNWLTRGEEDIARYYERAGRARHKDGIPLHECVRTAHLLKDTMIDYVREHDLAPTAVDLYAEEEAEHRVGVFFERLVYYFVKGYEAALREQPAPKVRRAT